MLSLNPYDKTQCVRITRNFLPILFKKFSVYVKLSYEKIYDPVLKDNKKRTHREMFITKTLPCASFYYINFLLEQNPKSILDIGCGMNFFKDIIPGIYGIDPNDTNADEIASFDLDFIKNNTQKFDSIISMNAIHFTSINKFSETIINIKSLMKPKSRAYISMGSTVLVQHTSASELIELFGTTKPNKNQVCDFINNQIKCLDLNFLVIDNLILEIYPKTSLDGDIRLVFENEG